MTLLAMGASMSIKYVEFAFNFLFVETIDNEREEKLRAEVPDLISGV